MSTATTTEDDFHDVGPPTKLTEEAAWSSEDMDDSLEEQQQRKEIGGEGTPPPEYDSDSPHHQERRGGEFRLLLSSNFFFLTGSSLYLWMAVEGLQWAKFVAAGGGPNYDDYYFNQLPPEQQTCAEYLGYDQQLWDTDGTPPESDEWWVDLTEEQQAAASCLGYDQVTWDYDETTGLDSSAGDDRAVVDPDELVFTVPVQERQARVSRYMIQYFVAAMCFVVMGVLDLIREMKLYPFLMVIAGIFGVISAMLVERNIHASMILNLLSIHFFFLEAIAIACHHHKGMQQEELALLTPFTFALKFADLSFGVGALIEVVLSYFYLLDLNSFFDVSINAADTAAQSLWVVCSMIYIVSTIFGEVRRNSHDEKRMDNGKNSVKGFTTDLEEGAEPS